MDFFLAVPHKKTGMNVPLNNSSMKTLCMKVSAGWNIEDINTIKALSMHVHACGRDCALFSCPILSYVKPKESLQSGLWSMVVTNMEFKVCWRPFVYKSLTILPVSVYYIQRKSQPVLPAASPHVSCHPVVSSIFPFLLEPKESYLK